MSDSKALVRKPDMELMPPPPPTKRIKRPPKVLDEDTYTNALSEIIARDFFPGLHESKCQEEYLEALESRDEEWIAAAGRKLVDAMTPAAGRRRGTSFTPATGGSTPGQKTGTGNGKTEDGKPVVNTNMSLDKFQAMYTSEDNASFNDLLDKQNERRREKYAYLWNGNKKASKQEVAQAKVLKDRESRNLLLEGEAPKEPVVPEDDRKALPTTWASNPLNHLMFPPDAHSPPPTSLTTATSLKEPPPKSINHANTRLPAEQPSVPASPSLSAIHDAISGNPRASSTYAGSGSETPRVRGYSFVATPSPAEMLASSSVSSTSTPGPNPFKIAGMSRREVLHHRMVDKVVKSRKATSTPRPGTGVGGRTPMTPAAQRLLSGMVGRRSSAFGEVFDKKDLGKGRWTPTPKVTRAATPSMRKG